MLEKLATIEMLDVHIPSCDGRERCLTRRTEPSNDVALPLEHLELRLPVRPPSEDPQPTTGDDRVVPT